MQFRAVMVEASDVSTVK